MSLVIYLLAGSISHAGSEYGIMYYLMFDDSIEVNFDSDNSGLGIINFRENEFEFFTLFIDGHRRTHKEYWEVVQEPEKDVYIFSDVVNYCASAILTRLNKVKDDKPELINEFGIRAHSLFSECLFQGGWIQKDASVTYPNNWLFSITYKSKPISGLPEKIKAAKNNTDYYGFRSNLISCIEKATKSPKLYVTIKDSFTQEGFSSMLSSCMNNEGYKLTTALNTE